MVIAVMIVVLVVTFLLSLAVSSVWVPLGDVVSILTGSDTGFSPEHNLILYSRLPRSVTALLAGAALGIAGLQMQTLFRNPLADPFALGISSGASLGVALVVLGSGYGPAAAFGTAMGMRGDVLITMAAIVGAALVLGLVLIVSSRIANP